MTEKKQDYFPSSEVEQEEDRNQKLLEAGREEVELDTPIMLHTKEVTHVVVRRPKAGELRGCSLVDLLQMDVNALTKVLPRVTNPMLDANTIKQLSPADLLQLGTAVTGFLLPKRMTDAEFQTA